MRYVDVICRFALLTVFAVAFASKAASRPSWRAFAASVRQLGDYPQWTPPAAAAGEAIIVVLMLVPYRWAGAAGFGVATGLLGAFTLAILAAIRSGRRVPCRCFGVSATPLGPRHVVRNTILMAIALTGLLAAVTPGGFSLAFAAVAAACGVVIGALLIAFDDLAGLLLP